MSTEEDQEFTEFMDSEGTQEAPEADDTPSPERDARGRFVRKEAEANAETMETGEKEPAKQVEQPEPPSEPSDEQMVPLSALKKVREEMKALKESVSQPREQTEALRDPAQVEIDPDDTPEVQFQKQIFAQKMQMSKFMAAQQAGGEQAVDEAYAAFDQAARTDPAVSAMSYALVNHPHPLGEIVKWHRQQKLLAEIDAAGGIEALKGAPAPAPQPSEQPAQPTQGTAPPPSLARGRGSVNSDALPGEKDDFDAFFN